MADCSRKFFDPSWRARRPTRPRREGVVEGALAGGALLDGDDGAALVDIDQRHIEPRAFLQELQVARAIGIDVRQAHQEEAVGDLDGEPASGVPRACSLDFIKMPARC